MFSCQWAAGSLGTMAIYWQAVSLAGIRKHNRIRGTAIGAENILRVAALFCFKVGSISSPSVCHGTMPVSAILVCCKIVGISSLGPMRLRQEYPLFSRAVPDLFIDSLAIMP